jgi:hypothetical protein
MGAAVSSDLASLNKGKCVLAPKSHHVERGGVSRPGESINTPSILRGSVASPWERSNHTRVIYILADRRLLHV